MALIIRSAGPANSNSNQTGSRSNSDDRESFPSVCEYGRQ